MSTAKLSIVGDSYLRSKPFSVALTSASSTEKAMAVGDYFMWAEVDWFGHLGVTGGSCEDIGAVTTQPATPTASWAIPAGAMHIMKVKEAGMFITARSTTAATGKLYITGPLGE